MQQDQDCCDDDEDLSLSTEDSSVSGVSPEYLDQGEYAIADSPGWKLKWRFPITALTIKGYHRTVVIVKIWLGETMQLRELIFDSVGEAEDFRHELERQQELDVFRKEMRLHAQVGENFVIGKEQITFLVEIVSARNLPVGGANSSHPFVKCSFNGSIIHQTKHIPKTCVSQHHFHRTVTGRPEFPLPCHSLVFCTTVFSRFGLWIRILSFCGPSMRRSYSSARVYTALFWITIRLEQLMCWAGSLCHLLPCIKPRESA
jgi:hypothetical protein